MKINFGNSTTKVLVMLKAGMNEIITTPDLSLGEKQILKSKEMFIEEMEKAINNELLTDCFFNRPDCIAELVWKIHENPISLMDDPIINGMLNYLIRTIASDECDYEWCKVERTPSDNYENYQQKLQLSESLLEVTNQLTIKQMAENLLRHGERNDFIWHDLFEFEKDYELDIRIFLFRLIEIEPDDYWVEGWI